MRIIALYVVAAAVFGLLDFVWLGKVGKGIYERHLGDLLAAKPNMLAALVFYAIYIVGITYFVTHPALVSDSVAKALLSGALLGLVAYATWNLTNLAVIADYPRTLVPIDMVWGTVATALTSVVTVALVRLTPWA